MSTKSLVLRVVVATMTAGAMLGLAACGSDDKPAAAPSTTTSTTSSSSAAPAPSTGSGEDPKALLKKALLTASDVGPGFVEGTWEETSASEPGPCGKPNVAAQFPNAVRIGAQFAKGEQFQLIEGINVFADTDTSKAAYAAGIDGLACAEPKLGGQPVEIGQQMDVTAQVGGSVATAWSVKADGIEGVLIAVHAEQAVLTFTFVALGGADTSSVANPIALAKTGVSKAMAA
jgi:hypothetical protein